MSTVQLNPQQREAVEHGEGPLLIVAGAGTGKTEVIVQRVGFLLANVPGLQPENILALTFARKAAEEMRRRAGEHFGPRAFNVRFLTFHSFCYDLLREEADLRALDKTDHWIFLRRHLEELDLDHYLKVSEPGRFLHDLVDFCSRCHDNLVSPADYRDYVERLAAKLTAQQQPPDRQGAKQELSRLREHARVFERSESLLEQEGYLTFGGMISKAVRRLRSSDPLRRQLQQRYAYVLVDEYQDTNAAQWELLSLLAGDRRNITAVGDDYQAIYRFRGAADGALDHFAQVFPGYRRIDLSHNRRSTQRILRVAGEVAKQLASYDPKKTLAPLKEEGPAVEMREFRDAAHEADGVAAELAGMMPDGQLGETAVLYRTHQHRDELVKALRLRGVPFAIRNLDIKDLPVIRDIVACLRVIGDSSDSISLVRVLADPRRKVSRELLLTCCKEAWRQKKSLWEIVAQSEVAGEWKSRQAFLEFRERFAALAREGRMSSWFRLLLSETGLPRSHQERTAVETFEVFLTAWEKEKSAAGRLNEFLEYFQYFEEAGGIIERAAEAGENSQGGAGGTQMELWEERASEGPENAVQLMTLHAAKGLEFERVFLFHLVKGAFPNRNRTPLIFLPDELIKGPLPKKDTHVDEERRLFYVGVTRAKRYLTLCTISNDKQRPSVFLDQLQDLPPPLLSRKRAVLLPPPSRGVPPKDAATVRSAGAQLAHWLSKPAVASQGEFALSVSQLETYQQCPLKYHLAQHWRIPVPLSPPLLFGIVVHEALKEVVSATAQRQGGLPEEAIREILNRLWPPAGFPDKVQDKKYRELGLKQLLGVSKEWGTKGMIVLFQEKSFELRAAGCRLVGRIDQLHRLPDGSVELVEYKTGRAQTQREADRSPQITLYAEACRRVLGIEPTTLILYNLTSQETVRTQRSVAAFYDLEKFIHDTARQILAGRFPAQPGFHCGYCRFRALCPAKEGSSSEEVA